MRRPRTRQIIFYSAMILGYAVAFLLIVMGVLLLLGTR